MLTGILGTQKRVRISHGKQAIGVRAIEVLPAVLADCTFRGRLIAVFPFDVENLT